MTAIPYSLALVGLVLTVSLSVLGTSAGDNCLLMTTCRECVVTKLNITSIPAGSNGTCVWEMTRHGEECKPAFSPSEEIVSVVFQPDSCPAVSPNTTTTTPPTPATNGTTASTTPAPTTPPTTNATTTTTTLAPTTNGTTTTTLAPTTNGTTTTPTPSPSTSTAPPKPTPAPTKGGFSWASFIGGIVFAAALSSVAYLIWRFYKVRLDRNYHTFANPTF